MTIQLPVIGMAAAALVELAGGTTVARAAILAEGEAAQRDDIVYLGTIPLFVKEK